MCVCMYMWWQFRYAHICVMRSHCEVGVMCYEEFAVWGLYMVTVCMCKLCYIFTCTLGKYVNMNNEELHMCVVLGCV